MNKLVKCYVRADLYCTWYTHFHRIAIVRYANERPRVRVGTLKIKLVLVFFSMKKSAFSLKIHFLCSFHKCNSTTCLYLVLLQ